MYEEFWRLQGAPFPNTIDERRFFQSPAHEEALARLEYVVDSRQPLGVLTGPPGTGKSLLLRIVQKRIRRTCRETALIDVCGLDADELVYRLTAALHLPAGRTDLPAPLWQSLRDELLGRSVAQVRTVILLDHFDRSVGCCLGVLERLLALDEDRRCCTVLTAMRGLEPVDAPVWTHANLRIEIGPLSRQETALYVSQSLRQAGAGRTIFEPDALEAVYRLTDGVPRAINRLCDLALLAAMCDRRTTIDAAVVEAVAEQFTPPTAALRERGANRNEPAYLASANPAAVGGEPGR